jgi:hypothetical protein
MGKNALRLNWWLIPEKRPQNGLDKVLEAKNVSEDVQAVVLRAALELAGWPRAVAAPQLILTAWCPSCGKVHTTPWKLSYQADRIVQVRRCAAAAAVYLQLDVEARKELPRMLQRLQACQVSWREWRARSTKMKARPRAIQRQQLGTYNGRDTRDEQG